MLSPINSLSESKTFYPDSFSGFSAPPPPFMSQPQQRCLKEITTQSPTSRRFVLNELQTPIQSSTSSLIDEVIPIKATQSSDLSTNGTRSLFSSFFSKYLFINSSSFWIK